MEKRRTSFLSYPFTGGGPPGRTSAGVGRTAGASLSARVALLDPVAGARVFPVTPGTRLTLADVPATATAIAVALATDGMLPVTAVLAAADE